MGKYSMWFDDSDSPDSRVEIPREDLKQIVNNAIDKAIEVTDGAADELHGQLGTNDLRRMAATTPKIAAGSYRVFDDEDGEDCGCAMVCAGRITEGPTTPIPSVVNQFIDAYDKAMGDRFGDGCAILATVTG